MNCKECEYCKERGRQQSQRGRLGRKKYYCENPNVYEIKNNDGYQINNFIGFGDMTIESPLQIKTSKRWCPLKAENKRKIIEIYVIENEEEGITSFEFEKIEDTDLANNTMKMLLQIFSSFKDDEDELEVEYE